MFDILTPKDQDFFNWGYTTSECVRQLEKLVNDGEKASLAFCYEWVALSLETQSVAYYKKDYVSTEILINQIASLILSRDTYSLSDYPDLIYKGLRAILSQTSQKLDADQISQLYRMLPLTPCAKTLDVYIMFQCHFGFTHILKRWRKNFDYYANENNWLEYNALQLDIAIEILNNNISNNYQLISKLDEEFLSYVISLEENPLAAEWFPWLSWFIFRKYSRMRSSWKSFHS